MATSKALISRLGPLIKFINVSHAGAIGRLLPRVAKILISLLFLLNMRSWPLMWHFRVFRPVFALRLQHHWVSICSLFRSSSVKLKMSDDWWDSIAPIGDNPFTRVVTYKSWASLDESDFNGHLSNSSYAKTLDAARFKAALAMFPMFFRGSGWMALAATHYHFIREIPILATYEVRTSIAAWDQKWVYVISRCVRKSGGKKKHMATTSTSPPTGEISSVPTISLRTPGAEAISLSVTPAQAITPVDFGSSPPDTDNELKAVTAGLVGDELDGATLHTIVISQLCFKVGRITVPPGLVLALNGFTGFPGHSLANPPSEWANAKRTMSIPFGGSAKKLKELMAGGWRDIPENERWWDRSLGERVEAQRVRNISVIDGLRRGLENARAL
ncbi:hypothetical protein BYT27DRAFT_7142973 [Phlegmacium glaucopus]|nr:hypothetical protein BYT27DRAFT_7142973 [Phlegmacium glaucopus]